MIALVGGAYGGKYLVRDRPPVGTRIGIVDPKVEIEIYIMRDNGTAEIADPYLPMDTAALKKFVVDGPPQ